MQVEITRAEPSDAELLDRLMQLYLYDFSELDGSDVDDAGRFAYRWLDAYWTEPDRVPLLIRADDRTAGFALVRTLEVTELAEFFVLRGLRRNGVGTTAARLVLAAFPGPWLVTQTPENTAATAFWRRAIPVAFTEATDARGRAEQRFVIEGRASMEA